MLLKLHVETVSTVKKLQEFVEASKLKRSVATDSGKPRTLLNSILLPPKDLD